MTVEIHGFCDPAFTPLKDAMAANFADGLEVGASLAVTLHGEPMVDLWAGDADWEGETPWAEDTLVCCFSATKVPLVFSFLLLVDRGLIDLDATVAAYWPEFAQGGKGHVTVREAVTFRAGVPGYVPPVTFEQQHDWDAMTANIAAQDHWFGGGARFIYHPSTYGFLLGEIMRRVDGRLPSQIFREEFAQRAGIDMQMGLNDPADVERLASPGYKVPTPIGPPPAHLIPDADIPVVQRVMMSTTPGDWTTWARRSAEIPAGNGYMNGRSMARLCAIWACGGALDGVRYFSKEILDEASRLQVSAVAFPFGAINLGLGFGLDSAAYPAPTPTSLHWGGYGGSRVLMDRATGVSFGYAMNNLHNGPEGETRMDRYWTALSEVMSRL